MSSTAAPSPPSDPRADLLLDVLRAAGDAILRRADAPEVHRKRDGSKVTDADWAAHEVIVAALAHHFPHERVVSEEGGGSTPPSDVDGAVWWVDPLDGTGAFVEGLAHWGPTVFRAVDGRPEVGGFWVPRLQTFWFAAAGGGAWRNGRRLHPEEPDGRRPGSLYLPSFGHRVGPLPWPGRTRALGSTAAHLAQVAAGHGAATLVPSWHPWDVGCGVLLVREAGRRVTDLSGDDFDPMSHPGSPFLAAARAALPPLIDTVRAAQAHLHGT